MKNLKHRFYAKTKKQQKQIQILTGLSAFAFMLLAFLTSWLTGFYLILIMSFPIVLSIIAPFFDVPSLKKSGYLTYHSLLFLSEKPKNEVVKIHGGTLFDYVFVIEKTMTGKERTRFIMHQYLLGLLRLIETYENKNTNDLKIQGTSYIINERTVSRIGFKVKQTDGIQKGILIYNFFNILLTCSIAKGKLSIPKLNQTISFEAHLSDLTKRKAFLKNLSQKLADTITDN